MSRGGVQRVRYVDSHTAGEPTRVIVSGGPDMGPGPAERQLEVFRRNDAFRRGAVTEPRGSDILVGAVLTAPADPASAAGVLFFNNVGFLGMCGHGAIGVVETLRHLGRIGPGEHRLETVVGVVTANLGADGEVSVENVPSRRAVKDFAVEAPGLGRVVGDIAWGGNWFFLVKDHGRSLDPGAAEELTDYAWRLRQAVNAAGHPEVDHIELFGPPSLPGANSRNFVLCPGKAYDRSPCGTGSSAKLACLAADGHLDEGEPWIQEGFAGMAFAGRYRWENRGEGSIRPTISGRAYVTAEGDLLFDPADPLSRAWGGAA